MPRTWLARSVAMGATGACVAALAPACGWAAPVAGLSGVVNSYQAVSAVSGASLTVRGSVRGPRAFVAGDRVLVIQMTGSNPRSNAGSSVGHYEWAAVASTRTAVITLVRPLSATFAPSAGRVQVVRAVGGWGTTTLGDTVQAADWDGTTGGVVALIGQTLDLAGHEIDADGAGFAGTLRADDQVRGGNRVDPGDTAGRGSTGRGPGGGLGGGGLGGGGGAGGGGTAAAGGSVAGGAGVTGAVATGTDGGSGVDGPGKAAAGGGGGGGGVVGGGGGGGGVAGGGGGGVAGGGGGGNDRDGRGPGPKSSAGGGGGGGVGSSGRGADGAAADGPGDRFGAGAGGGSYGGGGGAGSGTGDPGPAGDGGGGGGGGSWTGGGSAGGDRGSAGGAGNAALSTTIPATGHYLTDRDPRLLLGGAGGSSGSTAGGRGGGIIALDVATVVGGGRIHADGTAGSTGTGPGRRSGSGGGAGGGQILFSSRAAVTGVAVSARGGAGGERSSGGGGGGGIWLRQPGLVAGCSGGDAKAGVSTTVVGGMADRAGSAGGAGLVCAGAAPTAYLGDRVFLDANANGIDDGEPGVAGVEVSAVDETGVTVATTRTDQAGHYRFQLRAPAAYRVQFGRPSRCAFTVPDATADEARDSDPDPRTGRTDYVQLAVGATDGSVDAGLVCSTTSTTSVGGYASGPLSDLLPAEPGPFDSARATAVMSAGGGASSFVLQVDGIDPAVAGMVYGAHLHVGPCVAGNGAAAGPHYNTDVLDGRVPPRANPTTEVWLDFTVDASGFGISHTTVPFVPSSAERSIVIHAMMTDPATGVAGAREACLPLLIR